MSDIAARIQSALEKSRAAWVDRDHDEDEKVISQIRLLRKAGSQFAMSLINLQNMHAFWGVTKGKLYARCATTPVDECRVSARGRPALPPDAIYFGTYTYPYKFAGALQDLRDAVASHHR